MKRNSAQILTGLLLLLLFALPPAAKTVHVCQYACFHDTKHEGRHSHTAHHDCDTCAICQFVLSPFTETESIEFNFAVITLNSEQFTYWENINHPVEYSYMLRAPPCAYHLFQGT